MPTTVIEWDNIYLGSDDENKDIESLHNINKVIKCEMLTILKTNKIKSSVLGLLLMNCGIIFEDGFDTADNPNVETWIKKIRSYLKGSKNVWKCQDELQDLDLDEYAQL